MDPWDELDRLAEAVIATTSSRILRDVLRTDPDDRAAVWKLLTEFHPYARGQAAEHASDGSGSRASAATTWGAEELAAYYSEVTHRHWEPMDVVEFYDPTLAGEGFSSYQLRLKQLIWIFCGQPGRQHSKGFFEELAIRLSQEAEETLSWLGRQDLGQELNGILASLKAAVETRSVPGSDRWGGAEQIELVPNVRSGPVQGMFWRQVFTAFRSQFVINPPVDIRQSHRKLEEQVQRGRKRLHIPPHPAPSSGKRQRQFEKDVARTAKLTKKHWSAKRIAREMGCALRTVYYRRQKARERGLLES